ncbi:DUF4265 domain-containing protein [Streptomyces drozdowiczii]|uniref:DUF4265 domain-containing protein n=1 Tax=Streptomyces drozdowiczii TaxID=202862 RepID=A0ABY6PRI3_9ACTN|nr:DUF4265 domain-containing protein [Streptomyces drozdowiczii]MCX0245655.1 DUF4265 domain-containing protein [Streptomyces drozdowiczii]UZK54731.1 DUF4265 domain-containing protein [Streptomyces drozdowiczii]
MNANVQFITHDTPAVRPDRAQIAQVDLAPFGLPNLMEQVWLKSIGGEEYEMCCLPFRVYGLALGDVVRLDLTSRIVSRIKRRSGNRVFRLFFPVSIADREFRSVKRTIVSRIENSGLLAEWSGPRHVAIDVPVSGSIDSVWEVVRENEGVILWEWADVEEFRAE